jgi:hypothetical protein
MSAPFLLFSDVSRMQMVRDILKLQDVRRFVVSFGAVFCLGGLALAFFLRTANSDAVDAGSVVRFADGKFATSPADEGPARISIQDERDRRKQALERDDYRLAASRVSARSDQSAKVSDSSRANSFDQSSAEQVVYTSNGNGGLTSFAIAGSFSVRNPSVVSDQQTSAVPASQTNGAQMNDFPAANEPPAADKPMLGKLPRGYTYEQLLYRTWYGWGAYDWAQYQNQH